MKRAILTLGILFLSLTAAHAQERSAGFLYEGPLYVDSSTNICGMQSFNTSFRLRGKVGPAALRATARFPSGLILRGRLLRDSRGGIYAKLKGRNVESDYLTRYRMALGPIKQGSSRVALLIAVADKNSGQQCSSTFYGKVLRRG